MTVIEKKITKNWELRYYIFNGSRKVMISKSEVEKLIVNGKAEFGKLFY